MSARRCAIVFCVVVFSMTAAWSADEVDPSVPAAGAEASIASAGDSTDISPWIHPSMPTSVQEKLTTAFDIAVGRVAEIPSCEALFTELGEDALETLKTGLYFPASPARETSVCRRSLAQTFIGDAPTWICRRITSFSDDQAAMVVIHEALHHAGLTEKPRDRKAMSSGQINNLVRRDCEL